jgi:transcriptional regulator with XRE-family HTH domain
MGFKTSGSSNDRKRNVLGPTLRFYRQKSGLSAEELAARIELDNMRFDFHVSANHLHKIERQEKPITDYVLLAYAESLDVPVSVFFENLGED